MVCKTRIFCLMVLALLLPAVAVAQDSALNENAGRAHD